MSYTKWDAAEGSVRAVTRILENRRRVATDFPDTPTVTFRSALAALERELEQWREMLREETT